MAPPKSYSYLLYALIAVCVVLLAPYAGCHIVTTRPHAESDPASDDLGSTHRENLSEYTNPTADSPSSAAHSDENANFDDIEKALNAE